MSSRARACSPSCAIAMPRRASAGGSSRRLTRLSAPSASPAARARAAAAIRESIAGRLPRELLRSPRRRSGDDGAAARCAAPRPARRRPQCMSGISDSGRIAKARPPPPSAAWCVGRPNRHEPRIRRGTGEAGPHRPGARLRIDDGRVAGAAMVVKAGDAEAGLQGRQGVVGHGVGFERQLGETGCRRNAGDSTRRGEHQGGNDVGAPGVDAQGFERTSRPTSRGRRGGFATGVPLGRVIARPPPRCEAAAFRARAG